MKINKIILLSLLFIVVISLNSVAASEDNNLTDDSSILIAINESNNNVDGNTLSISEQQELSAPKTIITDESGGDYNEMNDHSIRNAINSANAGDTIIINGNLYDHTHVVIDKQLTIKSNVGTVFRHCSNQGSADSGHQGIFYLTSKASGTVIEGFHFVNDDNMLYDSEGYAILLNGASNVIIRNCDISNNGVADGIRLENSKNTQILNVNVSNAVNGIKIKNSQSITIKNSNIKNCDYGIYDIDSTGTMAKSNVVCNLRNC